MSEAMRQNSAILRSVFTALVAALILAGAPRVRAAQEPASLDLIPAPRQLKRQTGSFNVTPRTEIVLQRETAERDRLAAEILAGEIERITGHSPRIRSERSLPHGRNVIYLGEPENDAALARLLSARNESLNAQFSRQGYVLLAGPDRIVVAARTGQGIFYGVATLRQLLRPGSSGAECPAVEIRDWPAMRWRGFQDDISRGPITTLAYMERQIRTLASYKINMFGLYMENVYDFPDEPLVAPHGAALTTEEIHELVAYAKRYYITILPEQESFGHLHKILRLEKYANLAETPYGGVLAPVEPGTLPFIRKLIGQLVPLFPGPYFHIGADETSELGEGKTKALADKEGVGRVYLNFLRQINQIVRADHKTAMFWGDMAIKHPDLLHLAPKDMIAVPWEYGPRDNYDDQIEPYVKVGIQTMVSPGAGNWKVIFPSLDSAFINIRNFTRDGQKYHSIGVLNTTWNDDGESLIDMTWPALVFGGACGWQPGQSSIRQFWNSYDWAFYRNSNGHQFAQAIQQLAQVNDLLGDAGVGGASDDSFWLNPFSKAGAEWAEQAQPQAHQIRMNAENALSTFYSDRDHALLHQASINDLIFAAQRLDALGLKIEYTQSVSHLYRDAYLHMGNPDDAYNDLYRISSTNGRLEDLRDATTQLEAEYKHLWLQQYEPFWLGNVTVRYQTLAQIYQRKINRMTVIIGQYGKTSQIPPPEKLGFIYETPKEGKP
jgi:hypothetical protein